MRDLPHVTGYPIIDDPATFDVSIETPGVGASTASSDLSYLSFAPPEVKYILIVIKCCDVRLLSPVMDLVQLTISYL